ncbi:MAG: J domain-containing protein [Pseudomonadota bacterium]
MSSQTLEIEKVEARQTLGLTEDAGRDDVITAWRRLAFETHPDRMNGDSTEFVRVKEAVTLLIGEPNKHLHEVVAPAKSPSAASRPTGPTRPRRVSTAERTTALGEEATAICESALNHHGGGYGLHVGRLSRHIIKPAQHLSIEASDTADHIPFKVRRSGRNVSYIVRTPVQKGDNRVSLPANSSIGRRNVRAEVLRFEADATGQAVLDVPEEVCAELFPGDHSIRVHFNAD